MCSPSSRSQQLSEEEMFSKEAFYGRCIHNPSIRDRLPILTRSLSMTRKVQGRTITLYMCSQVFSSTSGTWTMNASSILMRQSPSILW